jgi:hypothetical protein
VEFVRARIPPPTSVLEVECGSGEVAASLHDLWYAVQAVDSGREEVAAARVKAVPAARHELGRRGPAGWTDGLAARRGRPQPDRLAGDLRMA